LLHLARSVLMRMVREGTAPAPLLLEALAAVAGDGGLDPAFRALALGLPGEDDIAQALHGAGHTPDPLAIHAARRALRGAIAAHMAPLWPGLMAASSCTAQSVTRGARNSMDDIHIHDA
jgi:aminopeptidase N